jgi:hypothetical protein
MKKSPTTLLAICDSFANGLSYSGAALANGVKPRTIFTWLKLSNAGDPDFEIEYMGEVMQWVQAMALARKALHMEVRARLEARSMLGHAEPIFFQGRPSWVEEEATVGWTEDEREDLGFARDGLKRDANGNRIQHVLWHQPPIAAALRVLEMSFGEEYTPASNVNIVNQDAAVMRVAGAAGKVAVPPKPVRPQLEVLPGAGLGTEPPDEPDLGNDDLLGPEPVVAVEPEPEPAPPRPVDTGPMIRTATPPEYTSEPAPLLRPLTPLQLSLLRAAPADKRAEIENGLKS